MTEYAYTAADREGLIIRGRLDAIGPEDVDRQLSAMQLDLIRLRPVRRVVTHGRRLPRRALIAFLFQLEQMLRAGIPLIEALIDLRDTSNRADMRTLAAALMQRIEGGATLSEAMRDRNGTFPDVCCALVAAGEQSGQLTEVLSEQLEQLKWEDELAAQTGRLMIYPLVLAIVLLGVIALLMLVVMPDLARFLRSAGVAMPWQTRLLIAASDVLQANWPTLLALALSTPLALTVLPGSSATMRLRRDALLLRTPLIGPVLRKRELAAMARLLAMLYGAGIPVIAALENCERVAGNAAVRQAIRHARERIDQGQPLSQAFAGSGLFPSLIRRMMRIGEQTGGLDRALREAAYFYSRDVREMVARAQALLEPTMTVALGCLLMLVAFAVLGPVYDLVAGMQP